MPPRVKALKGAVEGLLLRGLADAGRFKKTCFQIQGAQCFEHEGPNVYDIVIIIYTNSSLPTISLSLGTTLRMKVKDPLSRLQRCYPVPTDMVISMDFSDFAGNKPILPPNLQVPCRRRCHQRFLLRGQGQNSSRTIRPAYRSNGGNRSRAPQARQTFFFVYYL